MPAGDDEADGTPPAETESDQTEALDERNDEPNEAEQGMAADDSEPASQNEADPAVEAEPDGSSRAVVDFVSQLDIAERIDGGWSPEEPDGLINRYKYLSDPLMIFARRYNKLNEEDRGVVKRDLRYKVEHPTIGERLYDQLWRGVHGIQRGNSAASVSGSIGAIVELNRTREVLEAGGLDTISEPRERQAIAQSPFYQFAERSPERVLEREDQLWGEFGAAVASFAHRSGQIADVPKSPLVDGVAKAFEEGRPGDAFRLASFDLSGVALAWLASKAPSFAYEEVIATIAGAPFKVGKTAVEIFTSASLASREGFGTGLAEALARRQIDPADPKAVSAALKDRQLREEIFAEARDAAKLASAESMQQDAAKESFGGGSGKKTLPPAGTPDKQPGD